MSRILKAGKKEWRMKGRKKGRRAGRAAERGAERKGGRAGAPCDQGTFPRLGCTAWP